MAEIISQRGPPEKWSVPLPVGQSEQRRQLRPQPRTVPRVYPRLLEAQHLPAEVVRAGVNLLKQRSQARAELLASVLAAQEEGDRVGYLTGDELLERVETRLARRASAGE